MMDIYRDLGISNEGLDFQQLEDYITGEDMCLPEEVIPAVAYGTGRADLSGMNNLKLNVQMQSHPPQPQTTAQSMYFDVPSRHSFDTGPLHHNLYKHNTSLPDSPPDSGSEPYSPQDHGNMQHSLQDKPHMVPVTTIPGPMYHPTRPHISIPVKGPPPGPPPGHIPGYMHEPPKLNHLPPTSQQMQTPQPHPVPHQMTPPLNHTILNPHFGSMNNLQNPPNKKRKYPDSPNNTLTNNMLNSINNIVSIKQEPPALDPPDLFMRNSCSLPGGPPYPTYSVQDCSGDYDDSYDIDGNGSFMDSSYQVIKWQPHLQQKWNILTDSDLKDIPLMSYRVDADKGFNFSVPDDAFVCQKKNHFQVTVHIGAIGDSKYIRTPEGVKKIEGFSLHFYGIKVESASQTIKIEQSQSDRSKKAFHPVKIDVNTDQVTKVTVGRLHFSETTSNNMRKKGKPNPDQRYFMLVVSLQANSGDNSYLVAASSSEKIIVRASNPGQFDSDVDVLWSKGHTQDSVFHVGKVGVNTDHPDEAMTIHGNLKLTGHLMSPSDIRAKENLEELNTKEALQKVQQLKLYKYEYSEDYAETAGMEKNERADTGVIAQEMMDVLPEAVKQTGDVILQNGQCIENFLVVRKDRIFMENVGAVKELCKLTDNLENRIDELEHMNKKLSKLKRFDSLKSNMSLKSASSINSISSSPPKKPHSYHHGDGKSRHKHSRHPVAPPGYVKSLCTNRFIQITVIILILIMAFCLVAITTLYILERRTSTQDATRTPVVDAASKSNPQILPTTSAKVETVTTSSTEKQTTTLPTTSTMETTSVLSPRTTAIVPAYPSCEPNECEAICCARPQEDERRISKSMISSETSENMPKTTTHLNMLTIDIPNESQKTPNVINNPGGYNVINSDNTVIHHYYRRRRRSTATNDLRPDIIIKELNFTIGPEYCKIPGTCEGRNNSYLAMLSPYFGTMPITVQFKLKNSGSVAFCSDVYKGRCQVSTSSNDHLSVIGSTQWSNNAEFNLTIGQHYTSTYKFKISPDRLLNQCDITTGDSMDLYEYTLTFTRKPCNNEGEA